MKDSHTRRLFLTSDSGAATIDWVVLSALIVGLVVSTASYVGDGVLSLAVSLRDSLSSANIADGQAGHPPYEIQRLDDAKLAEWTGTFAAMTDQQLLGQVALRQEQFETLLAEQKWTQALQRVDYYHLISQEIASRGMSMPNDAPTAAMLYAEYQRARG